MTAFGVLHRELALWDVAHQRVDVCLEPVDVFLDAALFRDVVSMLFPQLAAGPSARELGEGGTAIRKIGQI
ncbi:MAG: hypothetical protein ABI895_26820 [Deltaproteobacteria bacterium]